MSVSQEPNQSEESSSDHTLLIVSDDIDFENAVRVGHSILIAIAAHTNCPPTEITAILANDFVAQVEDAWRRAGTAHGPGFTVDRVGGTVAAKNIPFAGDESKVEIYFNASQWPCNDDPYAEVRRIWMATHELSHPVFGRLRLASGALVGVQFPSVTPIEIARSITRIAVEEYRCEMIADQVIALLASITLPSGETKPMRLGILHDLGYCEALIEAAKNRLYPALPDAVDRYRTWQMPLDELWGQVVQATDQVINLLARAQAEADSVEYAGPLANEAALLPGVQLYLEPMWNRLLPIIRRQPVLPTLNEFAALEAELLHEAEEAVLELWQKLGIEAISEPDRQCRLEISNPHRI